MSEALWDAYLATAREKYEQIDREERYKIELGKALTRAREALLREERDWPTAVTAAITQNKNNIIHRFDHADLVEWIEGNVGEARGVLSEMWSEDDRTPGDRVRSFDGGLPESVKKRGAVGTRLNFASYFMMAIDPQQYPPYRQNWFRATYQRLGYPESSAGGEREAHGPGDSSGRSCRSVTRRQAATGSTSSTCRSLTDCMTNTWKS